MKIDFGMIGLFVLGSLNVIGLAILGYMILRYGIYTTP